MTVHIVRAGESVQTIASRYRIPAQQLARVNAISDIQRISAGQALMIPDENTPVHTAEFACIGGFRDDARSLLSFCCTEVFPVSFSGALNTETVDTGDISGILSIGNLTPDGAYSPEQAHALFTDKAAQTVLFESIFSVLELKKLRGVNFCFQYLFPFDRESYTDFITDACQLLHRRGHLCFVSLPLRSDTALLHSGHDAVRLSQSADRVLLLSKGRGRASMPPGPEMSAGELYRVLSDTVAEVPREKILLDIGQGAYRWSLPWHSGDTGEAMSNLLAVHIANAVGAQIKRDAVSKSPFFTYSDPGGQRFAVWFDDVSALRFRLSLVSQFALAGFCCDGALADTCLLNVASGLFNTVKLP